MFLIIIKRISFNLMIPVLRNEDINTTVNNNDISKIKREREIVIIQSIIWIRFLSIHVRI